MPIGEPLGRMGENIILLLAKLLANEKNSNDKETLGV